MNTDLVPALDPTAIPAPSWLFHFLLVFTFVLHALFMNLALGGTILAAISQLFSGGRGGEDRVALARRLMGINTYAISLAITTGIAPLLFVQVLYQQFFYTATILIGWMWLTLLVMLMLGYYAAYAYKFRGAPAKGSGGTVWLMVAAVMFLLIAMIHVAVNLIHSQPGKWAALAENPWAILADAAYFPRLLHFVLAAIGFTSIIAAWWAARQAAAGRDVDRNTQIARYTWRWTLWTTLLQILGGFLLLMVLPRDVLLGLMRGGAATMIPLTLSIVLGIGMLMMLARVSEPAQKLGTVTGTLATMVLTVVVMSITRHQVRVIYLQPVTSQYEMVSAPQWGNFVLFALLLVAGLATVAYMVKQVLGNPARGKEAA